MKRIIAYTALLCAFWSCGSDDAHQKHDHATTQTDTTKKSIKKTAMTNIGNNHIHIEYTAPAVRNRIVWGGLVPFGEVWVTGAHQATSFTFSEDVVIQEKIIKKGKYAFFTIPEKDEWTIIFNTRWKQHLADEYNEKEDVLRFKVKPLENIHTERLTYQVVDEANGKGYVEMAWEKIKIKFPIQNKN